MKVELNVEATIAAALEAAMAPGRIAKIIEEQVCKTVDSVIEKELNSYSEFSKNVKGAVSKVIPHDLDIDGAARFRDIINKALSSRVNAFFDEKLVSQLDKTLNDLMQVPPDAVTLSEIIAKAVELWTDDDIGDGRKGSDQPTIIVESAAGACSGYHHVYIDPQYGKDKYSCRCQIDITDKGEAYSVKVRGDIAGKSLLLGPIYDFDRWLFWIYTGKTRIVVDRYDFDDVYYPEQVED